MEKRHEPTFTDANLLLNSDGSIYHLNLLPEDLAPTIILVGDPNRVTQVSRHFDKIDIKKQKREFITHTGSYRCQPVTVLSTGIGFGNIDIVMNELDALVNIDLKTRTLKSNMTSLNIVRIGTCGGLPDDLPLPSWIISTAAFSFTTNMQFYQYQPLSLETQITHAAQEHFKTTPGVTALQTFLGSHPLMQKFPSSYLRGLTLSCPGFYAPQGRHLRAPLSDPDLLEQAKSFTFNHQAILNLEMETSMIYGLGNLLGHHCLSISCMIANRSTHQVAPHIHTAIDNIIEETLRHI